MPLITKHARYYAWHYSRFRIEYDDLVQEGILAALRLMESRTRERYDHAVRTCLQGMIRDAAERMSRQAPAAQTSPSGDDDGFLMWLEEFIPDPSAEEERRRLEIMCDLNRRLKRDNYRIAVLLMDGCTLGEIGFILGITKQAVTYRVKKIREELKHFRPDMD